MKFKLLIGILFISVQSLFSQDTCFTKQQVIDIATEIRDLKEDTAILRETVSALKIQNINYMTLHAQEQETNKLNRIEIDIYKNAVSNMLGVDFEKGRRNTSIDRTIWFAGGVLVGVLILYTGASIVKSI